MSHNQARTFPSHGFSTMPTTTLPRQQVMNQPFQPSLGSGGPSPTLSHPSGSSTVSPSSIPRDNNTSAVSHSVNGPSNNGGSSVTTPVTQETMYCDSCQTFRHVSFFNERDFKYGVCNLCQSRELQKRKHQMERYEMYGEQQRNLKQARYQMQYATTPQLPPSHPIQSQIHSPINLGHTPASSPQIKQPSPSIVPTISSQINPTKPLFSSPMRNQAQIQPHLHQQMIQALPTQDIQSPSPSTSTTVTANTTTANTTTTTTTVSNPLPPPLSHPPRQEKLVTMAVPISRTNQHLNDRQSQEVITFEMFVSELENETEFDRKQYHLDILPLMETLGEGAGFTQLGRGICEHVLKGTKFNFSLKDRRRSTKSPDTLSTLRYYCSQRADTAKPRKADHPKAQNRYDCAGALTIIIDLIKKTAHVTVIHKHSHPPFVSHHHHQKQQAQAQQQAQTQQQVQVQQQAQAQQTQVQAQQNSSHIPLHSSVSQVHQQQQQQLQQQHHIKLMKQRQAKQTDKQFEILRQKVADFGQLLESQQQYCNEGFLNAATEAFSGANELLIECQAVDSDMNSRPNKYTLHYNKKGDSLV